MKYEDEFPLLKPRGLYAADIVGDGNCLFSALSDQLFGVPDKQRMVRATTIEYMRANAEHYKSFLAVHAGGGTRRNPRRRNAASVSQEEAAPSEADINRAFENHLMNMARGGVYGDNHEIVAFCSAFRVAVMIYEADFAYMISPPGVEVKYTCHVAHHTWEHYSSVRNIGGPHTGWPFLEGQAEPPQESLTAVIETTAVPEVLPPVSPYKDGWKIGIVEKSLPWTVDRATITRTLEESAGDENLAIEKLLNCTEELPSSQSGRSTSPDSSDSYTVGTPKKKQDRRQSRASKSARRTKLKEDARRDELATKIQGSFGDSLEDLENATVHSFPRPISRPNWIILNHSDDEKESSPPPVKDGNTSESSVYSEAPAPVKPPMLKLKHTPAIGKANNNKRLNAARDIKLAKKREQKLAAKERKLTNNNTTTPSSSNAGNKRPLDQLNTNVPTYTQAPAMVKTASNPGLTTAIRTLHV